MLLNEQVARSKFEQDQRNEQEKRWEGLKQLAEDEMQSLREAIKVRCGYTVSWCGYTVSWCGYTVSWGGHTVSWGGYNEMLSCTLVSGIA